MISSLELEQAFAGDAFALDPGVLHVNHGSFGACPRAVLEHQAAVRARMEAATMRWFVLHHTAALDAARADVAAFLGCDPDGLVFVPNATHGVATALANLRLEAGDEVLTTDHEYRACRNAVDRAAAAAGARVVVAPITLPARDPDAVVAALLERCTSRTRVVLVDHVTSPTALVLDVAALAAGLPKGATLLVDGAHAPGQLELAVAQTGAAFYTGNFHKWVCAPKGSGFLWVAPEHRDGFRPLVTSHGATLPTSAERSRFRLEHDWTGTHDPSPYLSVPVAIDTVARLGGGWPRVRERNRTLARAMRDDLAEALGADPIDQTPGPPRTSMAAIAVELPAGADNLSVERTLLERGTEVPIVSHPGAPWPLVRVSAHLYNRRSDATRLAAALLAVGVRGRKIA
ncbi:MAG TPA: aminotransferase class V-fold PLP-dependent enzyme [Kofleriaceae bacterium]|nr:aminotransferase class V-fold PLP-dependent enzyme [Kofleriaceae bacterium]